MEGSSFRTSVLAEGFQIPDFKIDTAFPSIRAAYESRKAHADMHQLLNSLNEHSAVPVTFDGEAPELTFGEHLPRLLIGETYLVPNKNGKEVQGKLTTATVDVDKAVVYGAYLLETGESVIATSKLTDAELAAYKRHPKYFFGVPLETQRKVESPLEIFDFIHESYRQTPREKLLELLKGAPNFEQLSMQSQEELAIVYSERCAYEILRQTKR